MTFVTDKPSFAITVAATRTSHEPVMKTGTHTQVPVPMTTSTKRRLFVSTDTKEPSLCVSVPCYFFTGRMANP